MNERVQDNEFNAILKLTRRTKLDNGFDLVDNGDYDCFYDYDEDVIYSIKDGLDILYDALYTAYPLKHYGLDNEQIKTIIGLFKKYGYTDEELQML